MSFTVSELSNEIKTALLKNIPDKLTVEGEISNLKISNGNLFFTLKDEESAISVVSWSYEKYFSVSISNGDKVEVSGKLTCYSKNGTYSLQIFKLLKQGIGELHASYEKLKKKFQDKGYFDNKKEFPDKINNIGIVTSPEGAALQDILYVLNKNKFYGKVFIKRCMVQGNMCGSSVAEAIEYFNEFKIDKKIRSSTNNKVDLIMVTRGGGSFEDLMGFSDSKVVKAIFESDIFVMSAVGHEVDFMLSDFAADIRAPTPSIGAELISKTQKLILEKLNELSDYFSVTVKNKILSDINNYEHKLVNLKEKNKTPESLINQCLSNLTNFEIVLHNKLMKTFSNYELKLSKLEKDLEKFNFEKTDDYGMAQVFIDKTGGYELCSDISNFMSIGKGKKGNKINKIKLVFSNGYIEIEPKKIDFYTV